MRLSVGDWYARRSAVWAAKDAKPANAKIVPEAAQLAGLGSEVDCANRLSLG